MTTPQEDFWAGEFGDEYIQRNQSADLLAANLSFFGDVLRRTGPIDSALELGANVGMNVRALTQLAPRLAITAIEINATAALELQKLECEVVVGSILDFHPAGLHDLVFTKGVLIHLAPSALPAVYDTMAQASGRFVMMAEYYNPSPVAIAYRGHDERLFKRDFAGEFLDQRPEFRLVDYGFLYHRGAFAQDDMTWFLMERRPG